jgi:hypothetical protein
MVTFLSGYTFEIPQNSASNAAFPAIYAAFFSTVVGKG